jgi:hypothetical protein
MNRLAVLALVGLLPGCATILKGTQDTVALDTVPAGANCTVDRRGDRMGEVATTPGTVTLSKSRHDLLVTCAREGYQTAQTVAHPRFNGATLLNLLIGGVPGLVADAASGASMTYPPEVHLGLVQNPVPAPMPRPVAPQRLRGPGM